MLKFCRIMTPHIRPRPLFVRYIVSEAVIRRGGGGFGALTGVGVGSVGVGTGLPIAAGLGVLVGLGVFFGVGVFVGLGVEVGVGKAVSSVT